MYCVRSPDSLPVLKKPYVREKGPDCHKEQDPSFPPYARPLGHPKHSPHGTAQPYPSVLKSVIDLACQGTRVSYLITNRNSEGL